MKKGKNLFTIALLVFVVISFHCLGQAPAGKNLITPDNRVKACIGNEAITKMQNENPDLLRYYNYYVAKSFFTVSLDAPKPITGINIHTVKMRPEYSSGKSVLFNEKNLKKPEETINPMLFDFKENYEDYITYIWKEAGVAIVFLPRKLFISNYNNYKKTL